MAFTDLKIGEWTSPVVGEADRPSRTPADMKAVFDANSNQIRDALNALIDAFGTEQAAEQLGAVSAVTGLMTTIQDDLAALKSYIDDGLIGQGDMVSVNGKTGKNITLDAADVGAAVPAVEYAATFTADGWSLSSFIGVSCYTQGIEVPGMPEPTKRPIVDIALSEDVALSAAEAEQWGGVFRIEIYENFIGAYCTGDAPTIDLNITIKVVD